MGTSHLQHFPRSTRQTARLRQTLIISVICLAIYCFLLVPEESLDSSRSDNPELYRSQPARPSEQRKGQDDGHSLPPELLGNPFLSEDQCRESFPGLLKEIDDEVAKGPFRLVRSPSHLGPLIARIRDGHLYILSATRRADLSRDMLAHRSATLHQIANALVTWPRPSLSSSSPDSPYAQIPDTTFAFNHHDDPSPMTFSYSRPADRSSHTDSSTNSQRRYFPIPHFSFYSWGLPTLSSMRSASSLITDLEIQTPFSQKIPKAIWRGTTWFNSPRAGRLRQNLVTAFGSHSTSKEPATPPPEWSDIQPLNATNGLPIEDFCKYKYIIYTEGVTYSGRFQYHNLCASVVLTPPIAWMQHLSHLVKPLFSYTLSPSSPDSPSPVRQRSLFSSLFPNSQRPDSQPSHGLPRTPITLGPSEKPPPLAPYPAPWVQAAWPIEHTASDANMVFVAPDWSDLSSTISWLESHPKIAEAIAQRQRDLFHGGGYMSQAAEMCYWRGLISGWSKVVRLEEGEFQDLEEVPWEEFSLREIHK
ncbi:hypothetical protein F5Y18DRAFT_4731 [Xylariaceae sp. FL1019]|nr:hypothetical protein F5Y18DRAFT_4731 [Xylariaceae sp. FL1019]